MNEKELNKIMEDIKKSDALIIETDGTSIVYGNVLEVMALFCKMVHNLINNTMIDADMLHDAINTAKNAPKNITEKDVKDMEKQAKNNQGILEALNKLLAVLGKDED